MTNTMDGPANGGPSGSGSSGALANSGSAMRLAWATPVGAGLTGSGVGTPALAAVGAALGRRPTPSEPLRGVVETDDGDIEAPVPKRERILQFAEDGTLESAESKPKQPLVIPHIQQNQWRTPTPSLTPATNLAAQVATVALATPVPAAMDVEGVNGVAKSTAGQRRRPAEPAGHQISAEDREAAAALEQEATARAALDGDTDGAPGDSGVNGAKSDKVLPLMALNQPPGLEELEDDAERFRRDVEMRPDVATLDRYEEVPVHEFGAALLRGMGWAEGKAIGRNASGLVTPVEFVPRHHRLGLGATPKAPEAPPTAPGGRKFIPKPGESTTPAPIMVAAPTPDGRVRHVKAVGEDLIPLEEAQRRQAAAAAATARREGAGSSVSRPSSANAGSSNRGGGGGQSTGSSSGPSTRAWISAGLHVRLTSRSWKDGKYYNRKGIVEDVVWSVSGRDAVGAKRSRSGRPEDEEAQWLASIRLDDRPQELVLDVPERILETLVPKGAGRVRVVQGRYRGGEGDLLERNNDRVEALIQLDSESEPAWFSFDDVCEIATG